jgi:tRNA threonylcarbamoyladenosine biosynthesis protein TsaB
MLLAIDTSTHAISLALYNGNQLVAETTWAAHNRHSVLLVPQIEALLGLAQCQPTNLRALAVAQGPGSFSGLRVGISTAKGMAMALGLPLLALPTLHITAAGQPPDARPLLAVAQAGRGRVCVAEYHWQANTWQPNSPLAIVGWPELIAQHKDRQPSPVMAGEIDAEGQTLLAEAGMVAGAPEFAPRRAGTLAVIAWRLWQANPNASYDPATVGPIYVNEAG